MGFITEHDPGIGGLRVVGRGPATLTETRDILETLRTMTTPEERAVVLLDLRACEYLPTGSEAHVLAEWFSSFALAFGTRIAYLTRPGAQYGVARIVQTVSELRGARAAVFTEPRDAEAWLRDTDDQQSASA